MQYRYDEAYDGAGNQYSVDGDNATYDAENRLRLLVNPMTGATETFLYDGAGRRVKKSYSGNTTNYVYDGLGFLVAEYAGSTVSKEYIPFGSQVIAVENASGTPCQTCYLNYDHLGSVRLVTDQSANVVARHDYVPYGEEIFPPYAGRTAPFGNTDYVNPRFTGQMRDTENLLDFFNARYFGPGLGRFVSPDPMNAGADVGNPQSWNGYLYVLGNPLVLTDLSGMFGEKPPPAPVSPTQLCTVLITGGENLLQPADPCLGAVSSAYNGPLPSGSTGTGGGGSSNSSSPAKNDYPIAIAPFQTRRSCSDIANDINDVRNELARRFQQYGENAQPLPLFGPFSRAGHVQQITGKQTNLRNLLNEFTINGCGGGAGIPGDAWQFATRQAPAIPPSRPWVKYAAIGAGVIIVGGTAILAPELLPLEFALVP